LNFSAFNYRVTVVGNQGWGPWGIWPNHI
jgi:hypothetical protein